MNPRAKLAGTADLVRANEFARQVYGAVRDWDVARRGRWSTWEGGALLLEIDTLPDGRAAAPVTIIADDGRIAFHTRNWEADIPAGTLDAAVADLQSLLRRWFGGEVALAAFFLREQWAGSLAIDPARLEEEVARGVRWIAAQAAIDRVEIQYADQEKDQRFGLAVNGAMLGAN